MSDLQSPEVMLTRASRQLLEERIDDVRRALALGTLHEDDAALQHSRSVELDRLETMLRRSVMVEDVQEDPTIVEIGDEVDIEDGAGDRQTVAILHGVGAHDDRVSPDSPLGQALLGARQGDAVDVQAPAGVYRVTVLRRRRLS